MATDPAPCALGDACLTCALYRDQHPPYAPGRCDPHCQEGCWPVAPDRQAALEALGRALLALLDADPTREGLRETPARWARWWREFTEYEPGKLDTAFETIQTDQLVLLQGVEVWSLCEHHLLPFHAWLDIGYLTETRVLGISKLARIAQRHAHGLQLQERLAHQIADSLSTLAETPSVAVVARGDHLCMQMRGIRSGARMVTSVMRGAFRDEGPAREEFLRLTAR